MRQPNDQARDVLTRAAAEVDKLAAAAETEADLWRQCAEYLRRGDASEAEAPSLQASRLCESRSSREVARLLALVEVADPEYWEHLRAETCRREVSGLSSDALRALEMFHRMACSDRNCTLERVIRERLGR